MEFFSIKNSLHFWLVTSNREIWQKNLKICQNLVTRKPEKTHTDKVFKTILKKKKKRRDKPNWLI
jgi:hypothetical protein